MFTPPSVAGSGSGTADKGNMGRHLRKQVPVPHKGMRVSVTVVEYLGYLTFSSHTRPLWISIRIRSEIESCSD